MARSWTRFKSAIYTRFHWMAELYAGVATRHEEAVPLGALAPLRRPLDEARLALVTTAGVHLASDPPFDMRNREGDASFRIIPGDVDVAALRITHDYYDHRAADRDINCVFPIERLRELIEAGQIGELAPRHIGMMGHILGAQRERLVRSSVGEIARLLCEDGVDAVLATPG